MSAKDPEVKYTPNGVALAKFSLATNERFKDKSGEWQDRTDWHNVLAWERLAEIVGEYVHKGAKLYVEGNCKRQPGKTGRSGEKKYRTEIVARDLILLGEWLNGHGNGLSGAQEMQSAREQMDDEGCAQSQITDEDIPF